MTTKKLTDLTELTTTAGGDFAFVVDVSDTTDDPTGSSRKVQLSNLLPNAGVTAGTYGDATHVPAITLNAKGQVTAVTAIPVSAGSGITALTGDVAASGSGSVAAVVSKINGQTPGTAAFLAAGSANGVATLDSGGKVPIGQIPTAITGGLKYAGLWNASTNSPTLASGTGTAGTMYKVSTPGATTLDGISQWNAGDELFFDGTAWEKLDGLASEVLSVAGRTGNVVITASDIADLNKTGTLTDAATIAWDGTIRVASVTLGGNRTLSLPSPLLAGRYSLFVKQDGTGGRTLTLASGFLKSSPSAPTFSTLANALDILDIITDGTIVVLATQFNYQ